MTENPEYLIVYGTLRPFFVNPFAQFLRQHGQHVGDATFSGLLFDLAWSDIPGPGYPGAVYQPGCIASVVGTVYDIGHHKQSVLACLDEYEGVGKAFDQPNEYVRVVIPVNWNGMTIDCWVYLYNWPIDGKPVIASGDYVRYSMNE